MSANISSLSHEQLASFTTKLFDFMFCDGSTIDRDKEVNGGDLVSFVDELFEDLGVFPAKQLDPAIRPITVYFSNGDTITTKIYGTDDDIADHYLGKKFEVGPDKRSHVALCIRFNDTNETLGLKVKNIESGDEGTISHVLSDEVKINDNESYNEIMLDLLCGNAFALADVWVYDLNSNWIRSVGYPHPTVQ